MKLLVATTAVLALALPALALDGQVGIHDSSTVVQCDGVSKRLTLKKGPNIVRCAVIKGGGATDFCARFLDRDDKPLKTLTVSAGGGKHP